MNLNDFIVNVFCETDDFMKKYFPHRTIRTRGPMPQLADSEALTMEIVGEFLGLDTDKAIFSFFKRFYRHFFPKLTCRETFLRQATNLWKVKHRFFEHITARFRDNVVVIDSIPMPVCRFARARRSRVFRGLAAYGKELGSQTFYGLRLHLKINSIGMVESFELTPANTHDIKMVEELAEGNRGLLLGDRGYLSEPLKKQLLAEQGLELSVPTKYGKTTELKPTQLRVRKRIRRLIETVGSQLVGRLGIKKVHARDIWHLTNRICRKILAHTLCVLMCIRQNLKPLNFDKLVTA